MALAVLIAWQLLIALTVVFAVVVLMRRGKAGVRFAATVIPGAVLCYGFVSAAAGLGEGVWSASSMGFLVALAIGAAGLGLVAFGICGK